MTDARLTRRGLLGGAGAAAAASALPSAASAKPRQSVEIVVGGQWVGPLPNEPATASVPTQAVYRPQARIYKLARKMGIGTFKTYNKGQYVDYSSVTGLTRYSSSTRIPTDPGTANAAKALYEFNQMAAQVPLDAPYTAANAALWDGQTVETWMRENLDPPNQSPYSPS